MKEYRIIQQHKNGRPFSLWIFDSFDACYSQLLVLLENTGDYFHKDYYVFNDFFNNQFTPDASEKFKIEVRDVGAWKTYSAEEEVLKQNYNNKIIKIY